MGEVGFSARAIVKHLSRWQIFFPKLEGLGEEGWEGFCKSPTQKM